MYERMGYIIIYKYIMWQKGKRQQQQQQNFFSCRAMNTELLLLSVWFVVDAAAAHVDGE
jgi:hypothetical protein